MTPDRYLRMIRRFEAPPEKVYDAWLDPAFTKIWLFTSPDSEVNETIIDARVGGKWRMMDRREGVDYTALGEYLELDRPRRIVFTFAMPQFSPNSDTITVEFAPDGAGCVMTFTQSGVDIAAELADVPVGEVGGSEFGWDLMFKGSGTGRDSGKSHHAQIRR